MAQNAWVIVKFLGDETVEAVPLNWVEGNSCYWPGHDTNRLRSALQKCEALNKSWKKFAISTFGSAIYYDYVEARCKAKKAEDTSDQQSDAASGQKCRIIPQTLSTSEDEEPPVKKSMPRPPRMAPTIAVSDESAPLAGCSSGPATQRSSPRGNDIQIENIDAGPSGSSTIVETLASINHKLTTLITQMNVQRTIQLDIMQRLTAIENQRQLPPSVVNESFLKKFNYLEFPLNTVEKLIELEEILKDGNNFQDAVHEFANFGGSDTYDFIKRVLGSVLTNEITIKYSWLGRKSKEAFAKLKLASAVICAAEKAKVADNKKKCEGAIQSWLKRASERILTEQRKLIPALPGT